MGKMEYLDALKRAMVGLPPETQAKTLAYYEQRFIDGLAAGRSELEISNDLGDPKKIAMTLRASSHLKAFEQKKNPVNLVRLLFSALGLAIFNLFMVVPAAVYAALLTAMYACALGFYVAGIAITASGLSGASELVLDGPLSHIVKNDDGFEQTGMQTKVSIGDRGIQVFQEKAPQANTEQAAPEAGTGRAPVLKRAEDVASRNIRISTDLDPESRATQSFFGLGMVLGGIALFLLSLIVTKYTVVGIKRYIEMNFSLLKGS